MISREQVVITAGNSKLQARDWQRSTQGRKWIMKARNVGDHHGIPKIIRNLTLGRPCRHSKITTMGSGQARHTAPPANERLMTSAWLPTTIGGSMTDLHDILERYVSVGSVPGAVGLVARGDQIDVAAVGSATVGGAPMARDSIFRLASITKPITAAAIMMLVEDGRIALDDPVDQWLPELAKPAVVRTPASPVEDVVPAARPITVFDLLTSRAGYGFPSDFTLPAVQRLFPVQQDGRQPQRFPPPDQWMAELSEVPLLYQPGEAWLYDTCSVLQGVLITRASVSRCRNSWPSGRFSRWGWWTRSSTCQPTSSVD